MLLVLQSLFAEFLLSSVLHFDFDKAPAALLDVLSVNVEESIPTWFSTINLFVAACLLAWIALLKHTSGEPFRAHWAGLALIFLYLGGRGCGDPRDGVRPDEGRLRRPAFWSSAGCWWASRLSSCSR